MKRAVEGLDHVVVMVDGIDASAGALTRARERESAGRIRWTEADLAAVPFAEAPFDGALATSVLLPVRRPAVRTAPRSPPSRCAARQVGRRCGSAGGEVDTIRQSERKIQDLVVNKGGMPRPDFIKKFPEHETSLRWIDREIATHHPYSEGLTRFRQAIVEQQHKLPELQKRVMLPLKDLKEMNKHM